MAWLSGYGERALITVLASKVGSGGVTNKDVLLTGANMPAALWSDALASGLDVRVTAADGETKVNHQLVSFTPGSSLMELWFLGASLSSSVDSPFYLYWKNPLDTGEAASWGQGVWSAANRVAVWHLNEPSGDALDSTVNANTLTAYGTLSYQQTGMVGGCITWPGTNYNYLKAAGITGGSGTSRTLSLWANSSQAVVGDRDLVHIYITEWTRTLGGTVYGVGGLPNTTGWTANTWWLYTITYDGTYSNLYRNGVLIAGPSSGAAIFQSGSFALGAYTTGGYGGCWIGPIDEVRFAKIADPAARVLTDYNNQYSPSTFYTVGPVEYAPGFGPWLLPPYTGRRMRRF